MNKNLNLRSQRDRRFYESNRDYLAGEILTFFYVVLENLLLLTPLTSQMK